MPDYFTETVRVAKKHREYEINNNVKYYYIELDKFRKQKPNMKNALNQWLAFLDMERGDLLEMAKKESKEIEKALDNYEVLTGDAAVKRLAEIRFMEEIDKKSFYAKAESEGMAKGKIEIAKNLINYGMSIEDIVKTTGLSKEEIEELAKENKKLD